MSGVYIKGMEMPESCAECLNIGWQYVFECNLNDVESGARLGSCPLIPVPPHGRLIDADALCDGLVSNHPVVIHATVAPTVIVPDPPEEADNA